MKLFFSTPIEETISGLWDRVDSQYKKALWFVVAVNLLAFGYEMTNLTLHHDDVRQIFIQDPNFGRDLGRVGFGWLYFYAQNAHFMPFLQMSESIALMTAYGLLAAHLWGATKTMDVVLIASVLSVFPFMAQMYQYNTAMAAYPLAHLLVAVAVFLGIRARLFPFVAAASFYAIAFSIYQSTAAVAATIFLVWVLSKLLFCDVQGPVDLKRDARSVAAVILSAIAGGLIYLAILSAMGIEFDSYQGADKAFSLSREFRSPVAAILNGTRSFLFWPENYFPQYLKTLQMVFLVGAALLCLWLPRTLTLKLVAGATLGLVVLAPRSLQVLYPEGNYHNLALTGYAVVIAGLAMIVIRIGSTLMRNAFIVLAFGLIGGYVIQANWISFVNQLNTYAHYSTMTQILTRIKTLPDSQWRGEKAIVVGSLELPSGYPYRRATGVATDFIDAVHMQRLARLMRDGTVFVPADETTPGALEYAASHSPWPHSDSVGVVDGVAVVVLSSAVSKSGGGTSRPKD